jgi:hypothetical protein
MVTQIAERITPKDRLVTFRRIRQMVCSECENFDVPNCTCPVMDLLRPTQSTAYGLKLELNDRIYATAELQRVN